MGDLINGTASLSAGDAGSNIAMTAAAGVGVAAAWQELPALLQQRAQTGAGGASTAENGQALSGMMNHDFGSMRNAAAPAMGGGADDGVLGDSSPTGFRGNQCCYAIIRSICFSLFTIIGMDSESVLPRNG